MTNRIAEMIRTRTQSADPATARAYARGSSAVTTSIDGSPG
jgi:hypothetical protein